jgi:nitrate/nitrite transport system substrate-binding protein
MSDIEYPYDRHPPMSGCVCGRHRSQLEHEHEARQLIQCVPVERERRRYDGLLAGAALRSSFPKN